MDINCIRFFVTKYRDSEGNIRHSVNEVHSLDNVWSEDFTVLNLSKTEKDKFYKELRKKYKNIKEESLGNDEFVYSFVNVSYELYDEINKISSQNKKYTPKHVKRTNKFNNKKVKVLPLVLSFITLCSMVAFKDNKEVEEVLEDTPTPYVDTIISDDTEEDANEIDNNIEYVNYDEANIDNENIRVMAIEPEDYCYGDEEKLAGVIENYGEYFYKYGKMYGIDPNIMIAIAAHERGTHSSVTDPGGGIGLMQVQVSVYDGADLYAHNYETGETDKISITEEKLGDVDFNILAGFYIFRTCLDYADGNLPAAILCYNYGIKYMNKVFSDFANDTGITVEEAKACPYYLWKDYCNYGGDPQYVAHVSKYLEFLGQESYYYFDDNGQVITYLFSNHYENNKSL